MEDIKTKLTDKNVEDICKELGDNISETTQALREIISSGTDEDYPENVKNVQPEKVLANVQINPETGESVLAMNQDMKDSPVGVSEILEDDFVKLEDINEENMKETLKSMDVSDDEILDIIKVLKKDERGEVVKYEDLPKGMQRMVDNLNGTAGENGIKLSRKTIVKDIINYFKTELKRDQEFIDFQQALEKEMKMTSVFAEYNKETDELMSVKLKELADQVKETNPEKSEQISLISKIYDESKDFKIFTDALDRNDKATRKLEREKKRFNKYVRDFNFKYNKDDIKYTITSLDTVLKVLSRHTDHPKTMEFIILFCKLTMNMNPRNVEDHVLMYYTIKNITNLDLMNHEDELYISTVNKLNSIMDRL